MWGGAVPGPLGPPEGLCTGRGTGGHWPQGQQGKLSSFFGPRLNSMAPTRSRPRCWTCWTLCPARALLPRRRSPGALPLQPATPTPGVLRQPPAALRTPGRHSVKTSLVRLPCPPAGRGSGRRARSSLSPGSGLSGSGWWGWVSRPPQDPERPPEDCGSGLCFVLL